MDVTQVNVATPECPTRAGEIMVSIICNVFNHEKYIRDALEGFVSQKTDFQFEVLVHDDASTDDSANIIREYEQKYPQLFKPIYQTENQYSKRVAITRTFQAPRIRGKYVALCEGDDYWTDPRKLQKQFDFMQSHPEYAMCTCSTSWMNMLTGKEDAQGAVDQDQDISLEDIILEKKGRIFQLASFFVRAELITQPASWRRAFPIGDLPMAIDAAIRGKVHMLADKMCVYRYYAAGSWTQRMDNDEHRANVSRKMIAALETLDSETEYQFTTVIRTRIRKHQYTLALMSHDLAAILSPELRDVFRARKWVLRISDVARCVCPALYIAVRKAAKKRLGK